MRNRLHATLIGLVSASFVACSHGDEGRAKRPPPPAVDPTHAPELREVSVVEETAPGGEPRTFMTSETTPEPEKPAELIEPSPSQETVTNEDRDFPVESDAAARAKRGTISGTADIKPKGGSLMHGTASLIEDDGTVRLLVTVKLSSPGLYRVDLTRDATSCDAVGLTSGAPANADRAERDKAIHKKYPEMITGDPLSVGLDGTGHLEAHIAKKTLDGGGLRALDQRALLIYDAKTPSRENDTRQPVGCGIINISTTEPPVG